MVPGLGQQYNVEVEIISKPRAGYQSEEYVKLGLPAAPAIMFGDEVIVQGKDISEVQLEAAIRYHLARCGYVAERSWMFSGG